MESQENSKQNKSMRSDEVFSMLKEVYSRE